MRPIRQYSSIATCSLVVLALAQLPRIALASRGHSSLGLSKFITWNVKSISAEGIDAFSTELSLTSKGRKEYLLEKPYGHVSFPKVRGGGRDREWMEDNEWDNGHQLITVTAINGVLAVIAREGFPIIPSPDDKRLIDLAELGQTGRMGQVRYEDLEVEVLEGDEFMLWYPLVEEEDVTDAHLKDVADFLCNNQVTAKSLRSFLQSLGPMSERSAVVYGQVVRRGLANGHHPMPQVIKALDFESHEGQLELSRGRVAKERKIVRQGHKAQRQERLDRRDRFLENSNVSANASSNSSRQRSQEQYSRSRDLRRKGGRAFKEQALEIDMEDEEPSQ